ncbi:MAG: multidrug efflux SMR transporter [archaeon]|nr:multidrug efflux SMR transporter [archaeon]
MELAWFIISISGMMEPCWVYTLKKSNTFKSVGWSVATIILLTIDIYLLSLAMRTIGVSISYAVWTGIGSIGTMVIGVSVFKEKLSRVGLVFIVMIIAGIVGLNFTAGNV